MTKYDIIFEELQDRVDTGILTLEEAEILNSIAYEKYVIESSAVGRYVRDKNKEWLDKVKSANRTRYRAIRSRGVNNVYDQYNNMDALQHAKIVQNFEYNPKERDCTRSDHLKYIDKAIKDGDTAKKKLKAMYYSQDNKKDIMQQKKDLEELQKREKYANQNPYI